MEVGADEDLVVNTLPRGGTGYQRNGRGRRLRSLALCGLLAWGSLTGCGQEIHTDASEAPPLDGIESASRPTTPAQRPAVELPPDYEDPTLLTAVLFSENDAEITARIPGDVDSLGAELGDAVQEGQLLATLVDDEEEAELAAAEASLSLARSQYERAQALLESQIVTQEDFEEISFRFRDAEAAVRRASARLEYRRIRAPFAGVVTRRFIRLGEFVDEGDPLFRVTLLRPLRALLRIPEGRVGALAPGDRVLVRGVDGEEVIGLVGRIAPAVDPVSGTVEVLVDIPAPGALVPGSAVTVRIRPDQPMETTGGPGDE